MTASHRRHHVDNIRLILIIAVAIVVAILAIKVLFLVTSILIGLLVWVVVLAAMAFILWWLVRSSWGRRGRSAPQK